MKKKILTILLCGFMGFVITGCGEKKKEQSINDSEKNKVEFFCDGMDAALDLFYSDDNYEYYFSNTGNYVLYNNQRISFYEALDKKIITINDIDEIAKTKKGCQYRREQKEISMKIKDNTLTDSGMTLIMKNNSNQTYHYGPQYSLEKYENGDFKIYEPKEVLTWNDILYHIKVNEEKEEVIEWIYGYDKLKSGKYRLVRYFTSDENIIYSSNVAQKYYVEFEIK